MLYIMILFIKNNLYFTVISAFIIIIIGVIKLFSENKSFYN